MDTGFCAGPGMVMQRGFQKAPGGMCILWLFDGNVLDTKERYAGFLILTFLLGIFVELTRLVRGGILSEKKPFQAAAKLNDTTKDLLLMLLFGIQLLGAYFLMLIVMLYEPWMFFMVIAGLMTGYFIAVRFSGIYGGSRRRKAEVDTGMTCECGIPIKKQPEGPENIAPTTPCCGF
eukprot:476097_1